MANINGNEIYFGIIGQVGQSGNAAAGISEFDFTQMRLPDYTTGTVTATNGSSDGAAGVTTIIEEE